MQKIFYLSLVLILCSLASSAQITKGSVLLGGDIGFNSQRTYDSLNVPANYSQSTFSFSPSFGKAVKDNIIAGFDLDFVHQTNGPDASYNFYGAGLFLREYKPLGKSFFVFAEERLGGSYSSSSSGQKTFGVDLGLNPGISYQICRRVMVETSIPNLFSINYMHAKQDINPSGSATSSNFSAGTNLSSSLQNFIVGVRFLLGS